MYIKILACIYKIIFNMNMIYSEIHVLMCVCDK